MSGLGRLWREHRLLAAGFALALVATVVFAVRTAVFWVYWSDPAHRDQGLEGWMTPRYVAHSWGVDRDVVGGALGLAPGGGPRMTLAEIAADRGVPLAELEADLMAAIEAARKAARAGR